MDTFDELYESWIKMHHVLYKNMKRHKSFQNW